MIYFTMPEHHMFMLEAETQSDNYCVTQTQCSSSKTCCSQLHFRLSKISFGLSVRRLHGAPRTCLSLSLALPLPDTRDEVTSRGMTEIWCSGMFIPAEGKAGTLTHALPVPLPEQRAWWSRLRLLSLQATQRSDTGSGKSQ